jgi:uncharacterized protein YceK
MMVIPAFIDYGDRRFGEMQMKSLMITAIIAVLAGCSSMDMGRHSGSGSSGSSESNPRLDKQPDDMFHSWIN